MDENWEVVDDPGQEMIINALALKAQKESEDCIDSSKKEDSNDKVQPDTGYSKQRISIQSPIAKENAEKDENPYLQFMNNQNSSELENHDFGQDVGDEVPNKPIPDSKYASLTKKLSE